MAKRETAAEKLERLTLLERAEGENILIAGIDEVGRGPLAGPVVTACVCLRLEDVIPGVDDSKKLSEKKREALAPLLIERAYYSRTAWVYPEEIDRINILNATKLAMEECAAGFDGNLIYIDAVEGLQLPCPSKSIVHGDALSYMIAAASVVAKVARDGYMREMDKLYPGYGFAENKGYGTKAHIDAIKRLGPCPIHRRSFIGNFV